MLKRFLEEKYLRGVISVDREIFPLVFIYNDQYYELKTTWNGLILRKFDENDPERENYWKNIRERY